MRFRDGVLAVAGSVLLAGGCAVAQDATATAVPDPQIESGVIRALAGAPELATQNIQTSTVYGTVTLSGNVHDEALRVRAENLAARVTGVKKVVDELTLGDTPAPGADSQAAADASGAQGTGQVLLSDGTYGPPPSADGSVPSADNQGAPQQPSPQQQAPQYGPPQARRPMYQNGPQQYGPGQGQQAGVEVTVPAGAPLQIRINRGLDSNHVKPGTYFDGVVMADVVAGGAVAIPRGASVQGTVVDAKKVGALTGEGQLVLQLSSVTMGGQVYPVATTPWQRIGKDKTTSTVNHAAVGAVLGTLFGAAVGGGKGAAIGAGVGAGVGVADSASSPRGRILVAPESMLTFTTAQPAVVRTVSQQEMTRLSYAAGPAQPRQVYRRGGYYGPYYGPAY